MSKIVPILNDHFNESNEVPNRMLVPSDKPCNNEINSEIDNSEINSTEINSPRKSLFNSRLLLALLISYVVLIILSILDALYYFQRSPTVQFKTGSVYLDKADSTLQFSVIGQSDSLVIKDHKLSSQSYLNSYELQDTKCILSYNKDNSARSTNNWRDVGYLDLSLDDVSIKMSNDNGIQFHIILNGIVFKHLQDVVYLSYWYEPHTMKLQCTSGNIKQCTLTLCITLSLMLM